MSHLTICILLSETDDVDACTVVVDDELGDNDEPIGTESTAEFVIISLIITTDDVDEVDVLINNDEASSLIIIDEDEEDNEYEGDDDDDEDDDIDKDDTGKIMV
mgnify:FL=1